MRQNKDAFSIFEIVTNKYTQNIKENMVISQKI